MAIPFLLRDSCPQQWILWSSELNLPIPAHISLLITKMFNFTLAISCLATSNCLDHGLTFQIPMQYCSLEHLTLLPSPVTSTTGCCFCFGSVSLFFMELFLIGHLTTWEVHFSMSYLFAFSYCSWGSQGKNTEVVCHSLLQWIIFCLNSPRWPICLGWPCTAWLIVSLLDKAVIHEMRLINFLWLWFSVYLPSDGEG